MKKCSVVLVVIFAISLRVNLFASDLAWSDISGGNRDIKSILLDPDNPQIIYAGSKNGILKSEDAGESWRNILSVKGQNRTVNFLCFEPADKNSLYAAGGNGLFYSHNQGQNWKRIFQGKNYLENDCTTLAVLPSGIYLATKAGLFVSSDNGRTWHKETAQLANSQILAIAYERKEPDYIYLACADGVFRTKDAGQSWERIFVAHSQEEKNNDIEEESEVEDEEAGSSCLRYLAIDPNNSNYLYLATGKGVYKTKDRGKTWEPISSYGLLSRKIEFLLISDKSEIFATTKSGIFEYLDNRWQELSFGLAVEEIRFLAQDNEGNLYAACERGIFKAAQSDFASNHKEDSRIALYSKGEPGIQDVQQAAIKYAEVGWEKIANWRKQARMKAILPKLTIGLDRSEQSNYEIYTSANTRYVYEGPNDKSNGWDVTLSWDFSELIWNDAQTSIDVRSRLLVQLRDDLLDEVTKLYFERIRVKMELDNLSIEERKKRFEKELKLRELTAQIDALTGGYFSRNIKTES